MKTKFFGAVFVVNRIMKTILLLCLLRSFSSFSQEDSCTATNDFPDVEAKFPGGMIELHKFLWEHIVYPDSITVDPSEQSKIYLQFIVCANGAIQSLPAYGKNCEISDSISKELVAKMPNWIPAQDKGKNVASRVRIPIIIDLE